jgi:hypothetical protein
MRASRSAASWFIEPRIVKAKFLRSKEKILEVKRNRHGAPSTAALACRSGGSTLAAVALSRLGLFRRYASRKKQSKRNNAVRANRRILNASPAKCRGPSLANRSGGSMVPAFRRDSGPCMVSSRTSAAEPGGQLAMPTSPSRKLRVWDPGGHSTHRRLRRAGG